jgi:two-component system nitrogen regulation sensor histidine kinase NtrY
MRAGTFRFLHRGFMTTTEQTAPMDRLAGFPASGRLSRRIGPVAVGVALLSALATFLVLSGLTPFLPTHDLVVSLLLINALAALALILVILREVWTIVQARRRGRAAARLHINIIGLFAVIAAVPTILVAVVASITLDRGLDRFFSTRTKAVIENSLFVSEAYLREHAQMIRGDILAMATIFRAPSHCSTATATGFANC